MSHLEYFALYWQAFILTQSVEIAVVWYVLSQVHWRRENAPSAVQIVTGAFFANAATLPYLWFVFPDCMNYPQSVALGELTAFTAEGLLYLFLLRVPWTAALLASFSANACSVLLGLLIMPPHAGYGG